MIRNIPNKYTQQMLIDCINSSHANTYDFLYLRIDFKNKCNVGYAFINFIDPKSVILFAKEKAGKKWEHFNSDKRCALSYANIQGKDALIKKFKNSQVMFEDAAYRPKIFYSDGPNKGKEQAFPVPSDLKNLEENTYVLKESRHLNNSNHHRRRQHHHRRS
ncbi:RNA recognition motif 2-domain-containing protein [Cokeromyces recurvatus]|uniref:RNA recognition motif 2-domain-containing protein n=1 Tax=Cokeromyces recurvatus TaxID=90255 RepID=UPI002220ED48|nr:RNA recognition motif 2-domain-containing protein [Cokeromyces recurvatus]KAI7906144.1 RNA recognition motif 2-domain-containing protein [Cokeromyces recurvatus]